MVGKGRDRDGVGRAHAQRREAAHFQSFGHPDVERIPKPEPPDARLDRDFPSAGGAAEQLRRGYATASTNTGHEAGPGANMAEFAFDKPEQLVDFAFRSHHE